MSANQSNNNISAELAMRFGYHPISQTIADFQHVSLYDIVKKNTTTQFLASCTKYCYCLNYDNLSLSVMQARDNFGENLVSSFADAYVKQQMHSISGEQKDLCLYTYSPLELIEFLELNKHNHYTFLPLTVHAAESANCIRHDMLLIFDNQTKLFYLFDCKNRNDYLQRSSNLPKDVLDVLFINIASVINARTNNGFGYTYEPSESWELQGTLHPYGVGSLDFILSTAWCYNIMMALDKYDSPTSYMSILDDIPECDRFHFLYCSMLHLLGVNKYFNSVPLNAQVDLTLENIKPVTNEVKREHEAINVTIPHVVERDDNTNLEQNREEHVEFANSVEHTESTSPLTNREEHVESTSPLTNSVEHTESTSPLTNREEHVESANSVEHTESTSPLTNSVEHTDLSHIPLLDSEQKQFVLRRRDNSPNDLTDMKSMPIVNSYQEKNKNDNCIMM